MNPKSACIFALGLMVTAGGLVWIRMRDEVDPAASGLAVETPASKVSDRDESLPAGRPGAERAVEPGRELTARGNAAVVERDRQGGGWIETAAEGFERTSKHLVTDLGLSAVQAEGLEEVFVRREKELENLLAGTTSGEKEDEGEIVRRIGALLRNKGLRDDLVGVLSPQQLVAFDASQAKQKRETIEARGYRDLAEVNAVVRLKDHQKQEVLEALLKHAPEKVEKEADARAFMSLTYGSLAADMNPADIRGLVNIMNMDPTRDQNLEYGSMERQQWLEKQKAERIGNEISALQGILDEDQLARYRQHLESQMPR